ncbi:MAG: SurA N-terminal domain-containing protein [Candidatus Omnitrophica bacterium]|nr:SurA N-terminal domain-containing protein [Candidatus Omnitrophota bacterium]
MSEVFKAKKLIIIIGIAIAVSILIAGLFAGSIKPATYVGEISGEKISTSQLQAAVTHAKIQALLRYGKMFKQLEKLFDLEQEAWQQLTLLQEAKKRHIKVSNKEVIDEIAKNDIFYRNNRFDPALYQGIIKSSFECQPQDFEETVRESLMMTKLFKDVTKDVSISDTQLLSEYKKTTEQLQVSFIPFTADNKKESSVTDQEIKDYYVKNSATLRLPPSISVEYVLLPFPKDGGVQKEVETKYKAIAIVDQYKLTKDLKSAAEKIGFPYKETGFFNKQQPNLELGWTLEMMMDAFKMNKGQIHDPVELKEGYLVFKIKDTLPAHMATLPEAQQIIKDKLTVQKASEAAKAQASQYVEKVKQLLDNNKDGKALETIQKTLNLKIEQSALLAKNKLAETLEIDKPSENDFYALNTKAQTSVLTTLSGACLLYVDNFVPIKLEDFEKNKETFKQELLAAAKNEVFNKFAEALTEKADLKKY